MSYRVNGTSKRIMTHETMGVLSISRGPSTDPRVFGFGRGNGIAG